MAGHADSPVGEHQGLAQSAVLPLVVQVEVQSEAQAGQPVVIAAGQLVQEGLDHVPVGLTDDLELGPDTAQLGPHVGPPPLLILALLLITGSVFTGFGRTFY